MIKMTSEKKENQEERQSGHQNGHASPEIHLRGAEPEPLADEAHEMEDRVEDATSKAEDHMELDGLLEVVRGRKSFKINSKGNYSKTPLKVLPVSPN